MTGLHAIAHMLLSDGRIVAIPATQIMLCEEHRNKVAE
jgi:hypothetical protein